MNPNTVFRLSVEFASRWEDDQELGDLFWYQLVVETSFSLKDLLNAMCAQYSWRTIDTVVPKCWSIVEDSFIPLVNCATERFGKIRFEVVRKRRVHELRKTSTGKGAVANANLPPLPRSQPSGSTSKPSTSSSSQPTTADAEDAMRSDDEAGDRVPRNDDEDEKMFHQFVDELGHRAPAAMLGQDIPEEEEENDDMMIADEYDGDDMLELEWDRTAPSFVAGTGFNNMHELRLAITMYCLLSNNTFDIVKSQKDSIRFTAQMSDTSPTYP